MRTNIDFLIDAYKITTRLGDVVNLLACKIEPQKFFYRNNFFFQIMVKKGDFERFRQKTFRGQPSEFSPEFLGGRKAQGREKRENECLTTPLYKSQETSRITLPKVFNETSRWRRKYARKRTDQVSLKRRHLTKWLQISICWTNKFTLIRIRNWCVLIVNNTFRLPLWVCRKVMKKRSKDTHTHWQVMENILHLTQFIRCIALLLLLFVIIIIHYITIASTISACTLHIDSHACVYL